MLNSFALIVVIVIDQMRVDQMLRAQKAFSPNGISRMVNQGIFYDDAHHTQFSNLTCPGHTAISTGAQPGLHGISLNDDWDNKTDKPVYCLTDTENTWIGAEEESRIQPTATSAKRIMTSTVGDEVKFLWGQDSKVISVAIKDRSAIALAGHAADGAYFYAPKTQLWTTSTAFIKNKKLPDWVVDFNKQFKKKKAGENYHKTTRSVSDTIDLALAAARGENLGMNKKTDLLWISLSAHDYVSHEEGDDSNELRELFKAEDDQITKLITTLDKNLKNKKVLFVLTADHGGGIDTDAANKLGIPGGKFDKLEETKNIEQCLSKNGVSAPTDRVLQFSSSQHFFLSSKIKDKAKARQVLKDCITSNERGQWYAFTREDILEGRIPKTPWTKNLESSYSPSRGADVIGVLMPYWNSKRETMVSHETSYDYDSQVPLAIWWKGVKRQQVHRRVAVTSLAPTLTRILGARRPSGSTYEYLQEVLDQLP